MDADLLIRKFLFIFIPFLLAMSFHELAHAVFAQLRGDNTAKLMGRVSLNPFAHVDWVGTFILPLSLLMFGAPVFLGWAKPVPVNPSKLKWPRFDMVLIAAAGPLANVFLALLATVLLGAFYPSIYGHVYANDAVYFAHFFIKLNLFLAVFNMIPLHPLDGSKVLLGFLPESLAKWIESNEMISSAALFLLVLSGTLGVLFGPIVELTDFLVAFATSG